MLMEKVDSNLPTEIAVKVTPLWFNNLSTYTQDRLHKLLLDYVTEPKKIKGNGSTVTFTAPIGAKSYNDWPG